MPTPPSAAPRSSTLALVLAWTLVILPTAWGLEHTVQSALKLFQAPAATATQAPAGQTASPAAKP